MSNTRVQVRDLAENKLQPAARPIDTFVRPQVPVDDRRTEQLLEALGATNGSLAKLAFTMRATREGAQEAERQREKNVLLMADPAHRDEIARTGRLPDGTEIKDAQVRKMSGAVIGPAFEDSVMKSLSGRDLTGVDVVGEVRKLAAPQIEAMQGDTFRLGGYLPHVESATQRALDMQTRQSQEARKTFEEGTTFQYLSNQVDAWTKEGASPEDMRKGMSALYSTVAAGHSALVTPELLDGYRIQKAQQLVGSNPQAAVALLDQDVTGPDGKARPSLADDPRFTNQVFSIGQQAKAAMVKQQTATAFADRRHDNLQRVLVGNDYRSFDTLEVNGQKLTGDEQNVQMLADINASYDREIAAGRATEQSRRQAVRTVTSRMGIDDPFVKGELNGIERRYSTADTLSNPDVLRDVENRVAWWKDYSGAARNSLNAQLSDTSKRFYAGFDGYKRYVSDSTEGALEFANRVTNPPDGWERSLSGKQADDLETEIKNKIAGSGIPGFGTGDSSVYSQMYFGEVKRMATLFISAGMNPEKAATAATDSVFANRVAYHGDPLVGLEKQRLPENYVAVLDNFAEHYRTQDARGKAYKGTPTFATADGGTIVMRDRDSGAYLEDQNGKLIVFDLQHLRDASARMETEDRQRFARDAAVEQQRQRDQLQNSPGMARKRTILDWIGGLN